MSQDMTEGAISRTLIAFAVPLMLSNLLQQLYNWADALIVGNFLGEEALAAVGATGAISGILITVLVGFAVGVSILTAQLYGSGEREGIGRILSLFILVLGSAGILIALLGLVVVDPLLQLLQTPLDVLTVASLYLKIILVGIPFLAVYNVYSAVLRGIGDSRTPMLAILISSITNVFLVYLFIAIFGFGVEGAAYATVIAQMLMTVFIVFYTRYKHTSIRLGFGRATFDKQTLQNSMQLSLPTAAQAALRSMGNMMLQTVMNSFGSQTVAAITTAYRIDSIGLLPVGGLGAAMATFAAQNKGAAKEARAAEGLMVCLKLACGVAFAITLVVTFAGNALLSLFGMAPDTVAIGQGVLIRLAVFYPLFGIVSALNGYLQGMGDVRFVAYSTIGALATRIGFSYLFAPLFGSMVIAYAEAFSWACQVLICYWRLRQRRVTLA